MMIKEILMCYYNVSNIIKKILTVKVTHQNELHYKSVMADMGGAGQGTLCLQRHRNALSKIKVGGIDPKNMNVTECSLYVAAE